MSSSEDLELQLRLRTSSAQEPCPGGVYDKDNAQKIKAEHRDLEPPPPPPQHAVIWNVVNAQHRYLKPCTPREKGQSLPRQQ